MHNGYPFRQTASEDGTLLREFSQDVDTSELVWHRDRHDRLVTVVESAGWKLQMDGRLPEVLEAGTSYYIPKETYHRVIKGRGRLVVEIKEMGKKIKVSKHIRRAMAESHPKQYKAPEGSKRDKQLDQTQKDLDRAKELRKQGKAKKAKELEQRAYARRDRMEKKAREKNESVSISESQLRKLVRFRLLEKKNKISKKTEKTLKKKAEESGYTLGSVKSEFRKGLGAFYSSGSRPGMTAHQWAMARVNKAIKNNPSWANLKKSKRKKKK